VRTRLSNETAARECTPASIEDDLVRRLKLYLQPEDERNVTLTDIARAIWARWLSI